MNPQFLQQHITPVITRAIAASQLSALLQEVRQAPGTGTRSVLVIRHGVSTHLKLLHLTDHGGLCPFLARTRDVRLLREEFLELAADGGGVVVARDFSFDLVERYVAIVTVVSTKLFGARALRIDVLFRVRWGGLGVRSGAIGGGFRTARVGCCFRHLEEVMCEVFDDQFT